MLYIQIIVLVLLLHDPIECVCMACPLFINGLLCRKSSYIAQSLSWADLCVIGEPACVCCVVHPYRPCRVHTMEV